MAPDDDSEPEDEELDEESLWPAPPDDTELGRRVAAVSASWRARLLAAIEAYESLDTFYEECGGETSVTVIDGVEHTQIQMSYTNYANEAIVPADLLTEADLFPYVPILDWDQPEWYQEGDDLSGVSIPDVLRHLSALWRADRFMDGTLAFSIDTGFFPALLGRLKKRFSDLTE